MTRGTYVGGVAAICGTILVSAGLLAQEKPYEAMTPEQQAMMQAFEEYRTPGAQHEMLAKRAGKWNVQGKMWQGPGAPAEPFEATSTVKSVMGGRYIIEHVDSEFMGEPFKGFGISGYDNLTDTYVAAWIDSFSTGILRYEGTPSGDGKTIHYTGEHPDVLGGRYAKVTSVEQLIDDDKHVHTTYFTGPDGQEYKHMELIYIRDAAPGAYGEKIKKNTSD